jgi:hypothetical protein
MDGGVLIVRALQGFFCICKGLCGMVSGILSCIHIN